MDLTYWKNRAVAAERALTLARSGLTITEPRAALIDALGDLKPDERLSATELARRLDWSVTRVAQCADSMVDVGLLERESSGPGRGHFVYYRLGYLVQAPEKATGV